MTEKEMDQADLEKLMAALKMLKETMSLHPEIDFPHWVTAFMASMANVYAKSGISFGGFLDDMLEAIMRSKTRFKYE